MKFGEEKGGGGEWTSKLGRGSHGCGLWKNIRMGWGTFSHCTRFVNGMENWVRFWHDCWCGDHPLKAAFPVLYEIAIDREAFVESTLVRQGVGERSGDGLLSWVGVHMVVVFGKTLEWVGKPLVIVLGL